MDDLTSVDASNPAGADDQRQQLSRATILRAPGRQLVKAYRAAADGKVAKRSYDNARMFYAETVAFTGIGGLSQLLEQVQDQPDKALIRAVPSIWHPGADQLVRRIMHPAAETANCAGTSADPF